MQIAKFLYLDDDAIRSLYKTYREDGWDALSVDDWTGGQSRMTSAQQTELFEWLDGRFCRSTVSLCGDAMMQTLLVDAAQVLLTRVTKWSWLRS